MKLLRLGLEGHERPAILASDGTYRDLSEIIADISAETISDLAGLLKIDPKRLPIIPAETRIGPCIGNPSKFICVGLNYAEHAAEANAPIPQEPILFMKAVSALCGPNDEIFIPPNSRKTDWEVELGVVISKTARHVREVDASAFIAGYCLINDVSEREYQMERGGTWDKGKGYDRFGPIGPYLVTPDDIPDPQNLAMWLEVDGRRFQDGNTSTMIFSVNNLVSYISQFMTLHPGDIISTGTPSGVGTGQNPPIFLKPGQTVRLGIEHLGEQRQTTLASPYGCA
jgi:2-keto-4-pentenoate hydratase/2-oxohepta-3-ene-1,7-dioic acid hydratase in catechol pathway